MAEKPEDLSLPASVVTRIIKDALPEGVNVSKETRTAIGKAASVFILYSTACANNFALKGKRKTLNASDVFSALEDMEFEQFVPELKDCLEAYKQEQKEKKEAAADRKKKQQAAAAAAAAIAVSSQVMAEPVPSGGETSGITQPGGLVQNVESANATANIGSGGGDNDEGMEVDVNGCTTQIPTPVTVVTSSVPTGT